MFNFDFIGLHVLELNKYFLHEKPLGKNLHKAQIYNALQHIMNTVEKWCELWFETYSKPHLRPSTAQSYRVCIDYHIVPYIAKTKLKKLSSIQIQQLYNKLKTSGRVQRYENMADLSLSNKSVRTVHNVLHLAMEQAKKEGIIEVNPCDNCKVPKLEKKEMQILPIEKMSEYLQKAEECGVYAMFYLELSTGLRRGELLALTWQDVDEENLTISVNKAVSKIKGGVEIREPKTENAVRTIAISEQMLAILHEEKAKHPQNPLLFPSPKTGEHYHPDAVSKLHKKLLKLAKIEEKIPLHSLRHTFSVVALQCGVDIKTLSKTLGHHSSAFTLDTYTHVTEKMNKSVADKVGGFMERIG